MEQQLEIDHIKTFGELISSPYLIKIPAYQRAYAWGEEQIDQFVNDLLEIQGKGYYYGHFILEKDQEQMSLEVIDGQQRITTYVLFVLSAKLYGDYDIKEEENFIINNFKTIDYDEDRFRMLVDHILNKGEILEEEKEDTSSFKRILKAIKGFEKFFEKKKNDDSFQIQKLIKALKDAHISTHTTEDKEVAVQIFELQNSRGIPLDLMEKFKSRLMKAIYLCSKKDKVDDNIIQLQDHFARIYELEEKTIESSFRGNLTLENILLYHLRVTDDGSTLSAKGMETPAYGNNEKNVLDYLSQKLDGLESDESRVNYIINLTEHFKTSVEFTCETLIEKDKINPLVGDCLILDRRHSMELYLILLHHNKFEEVDLKKWELFLFTRDFHGEYKGKNRNQRDNFQWIYSRILKRENESINQILDDYIENGFRGKRDGYKLQDIFKESVLEKHKETILNNAFNFWKEKMVYVLYKYEIQHYKEQSHELREGMRQYFKAKKSVEHILPQNWHLDWINHDVDKEEFIKEINSGINGIGNLMIIDSSENSSQSNKHPKDKEYALNVGSYKQHSDNISQWQNSGNWLSLIKERGNNIYKFMNAYFRA